MLDSVEEKGFIQQLKHTIQELSRILIIIKDQKYWHETQLS